MDTSVSTLVLPRLLLPINASCTQRRLMNSLPGQYVQVSNGEQLQLTSLQPHLAFCMAVLNIYLKHIMSLTSFGISWVMHALTKPCLIKTCQLYAPSKHALFLVAVDPPATSLTFRGFSEKPLDSPKRQSLKIEPNSYPSNCAASIARETKPGVQSRLHVEVEYHQSVNIDANSTQHMSGSARLCVPVSRSPAPGDVLPWPGNIQNHLRGMYEDVVRLPSQFAKG